MKPVASEAFIRKHVSEANQPHFPRDVFPEFLFRIRQVEVNQRLLRSWCQAQPRAFCLQPTPGVNQSSVQCLRYYALTAEPFRVFVDVDGELCVSQMMEVSNED